MSSMNVEAVADESRTTTALVSAVIEPLAPCTSSLGAATTAKKESSRGQSVVFAASPPPDCSGADTFQPGTSASARRFAGCESSGTSTVIDGEGAASATGSGTSFGADGSDELPATITSVGSAEHAVAKTTMQTSTLAMRKRCKLMRGRRLVR
jgi:hypothetical protein